MSLAALLVAVADHLTSNTSKIRIDREMCDVKMDGQPDEHNVDLFIAVHPAQWNQTNDAGTALDESFGFQITISMRGRKIPTHDWGRMLLCAPRKGTAAGGLYSIAEAIRATLHGNYTALDKANSMIDIAAGGQGTTANGFDGECIFFQSCDLPVKRRADWWGSNTESLSEKGSPYAGVSVTMNFRPVRRVQDIASQT